MIFCAHHYCKDIVLLCLVLIFQAHTGSCTIVDPGSGRDDLLVERCEEDAIELVLPYFGLKDTLNSLVKV